MIDPEHPDYTNSPVAPGRPHFIYRPADAASTPAVSVITPYYNTDEVFLETAKSLFGQSFQDFEWIIVDDGSTDTPALARLHAVRDSDARIRVIVQENTGPAAARNTAFRHCAGRYICLLDSDDMLEPTFIEKCVWFLESNPDFGFCNAWSVSFGFEEFLWRVGFEQGKVYLQANKGPVFSVLRREAFEVGGGYDASIRFGHEDWDFWLARAKAGFWGYTLPEYLTWYRKRSSSRYYQVLGSDAAHRDFKSSIGRKYANLQSDFPAPVIKPPEPYEHVPEEIPFDNRLDIPENMRRILFLVPWMLTGGDAETVNLEWVAGLIRSGYQVTLCAAQAVKHNGYSDFAGLTPDIFILPNFLRCADYPRFLNYLIRSRRIDTVMIAGSTFGYLLLPFLRTNFPETVFVDLCAAEAHHGMNGDHPMFALDYHEMLDLSLVTTANLRDWMVERGASPERVVVCSSGSGRLIRDDGHPDDNRARDENGLSDRTNLPAAIERAHRLVRGAVRRTPISRSLAQVVAKLAVEVMRLSGGAEFFHGKWIQSDEEAREQHRQALQQELEHMRIGLAWMTEQRDAWERETIRLREEIGKGSGMLRALRRNPIIGWFNAIFKKNDKV